MSEHHTPPHPPQPHGNGSVPPPAPGYQPPTPPQGYPTPTPAPSAPAPGNPEAPHTYQPPVFPPQGGPQAPHAQPPQPMAYQGPQMPQAPTAPAPGTPGQPSYPPMAQPGQPMSAPSGPAPQHTPHSPRPPHGQSGAPGTTPATANQQTPPPAHPLTPAPSGAPGAPSPYGAPAQAAYTPPTSAPASGTSSTESMSDQEFHGRKFGLISIIIGTASLLIGLIVSVVSGMNTLEVAKAVGPSGLDEYLPREWGTTMLLLIAPVVLSLGAVACVVVSLRRASKKLYAFIGLGLAVISPVIAFLIYLQMYSQAVK